MIKFYNPFKPHIVEDGFGKFWIRILLQFHWAYYYQAHANFYYSKSSASQLDTLESAREMLKEVNEAITKYKQKKKALRAKDKVVQ